MKQGIALLNENTEASLNAAVQAFDRALAMRLAILQPADHWMAYLTAASWMNRADALTRLGHPAGIEEAVRSYDEALALMRHMPIEANPLYRRRLAIAWMNRGISLHQRETPASFSAAAESFERVIEVTREHPEHEFLLACSWTNRGNALLRMEPSRPAEARASAAFALGLLGRVELQEVTAAGTALKARYIICQAAAEMLAGESATGQASDLVSVATDMLEEGIRLARHWEGRGETGFRPMLADFFRFGVAVYRAHLPHFLAEFVLEHLDPTRSPSSLAGDPEMGALAADALAAVARDFQTDGFASVQTPRFSRAMEALRALQQIEGRLRSASAPQVGGTPDFWQSIANESQSTDSKPRPLA